MDHHHCPVQPPPMATAAAGAAFRLLCRLVRAAEFVALALLVSWSSSCLPFAAGPLLRAAVSLLLHPRFVFALANAIVLLLLVLSRGDPDIRSCPINHEVHDHFFSFTTAQLPPTAGAPTTAEDEVFEDKQAVHVTVRAPRRSTSEKAGGRRRRRAASPELRRLGSEDCRRRRSSATAQEAEEWGAADAEEFRRTVEAFIAKQARFHRQESMTMAVVAVEPAIAGAVAVVK